MITTDLDRFLALARACAPDFGPATARAASARNRRLCQYQPDSTRCGGTRVSNR